jgi:hypothetical protein
MSIQFRISSPDDPQLLVEAEAAACSAGLEPKHPARFRDIPASLDILVALGSAGAFTALYQVIASLLAKNKDRELTIERKGLKLTLKGHSLPEEKALLLQLAPELVEKPEKVKTKKPDKTAGK